MDAIDYWADRLAIVFLGARGEKVLCVVIF